MLTHQKPHLTDFDIHLWNQSRHYRAYEKLGAHPYTHDGSPGVHFAVWAPNARQVSVIGDFNAWKADTHRLQLSERTGIWHGFIPGLRAGENYKYSLLSHYNDYRTERADPYGFFAQRRPETASKVWQSEHRWQDAEWLEQRKGQDLHRMPLNIYEVHLGSWMRDENGDWLNYRDLATELAHHVNELGYTHVELLPVTEHPFDGSWGYQVTGYFAPTSRFGTPDDFKFLVDTLHQHDIGVILDWVPAHFPKDGHGLAYFDGTHLYEHADPRLGEHPEWGTLIFNYGRPEVRNFLISSALFWLDHYHIDGLRVDAVASMLYLDYGRDADAYIPNKFGGRENLEAVEFLREFNQAVKEYYPDVFTCAEESTAWPKVTGDATDQGLGFTFKWNMGWMNDTLEVFEKEPVHRKFHHNKLTFGMMYQYSEHFMLPLSHDEVVHLKKAMLTKMPGDDWQRFANLRLLLGYQIGFPGKKLGFMGAEIGQWGEWNFEDSLDWDLLHSEPHQSLMEWVSQLNHLYREEPALFESDSSPEGFQWINCDDWERSMLSFVRFNEKRDRALLFVLNLTPVPRPDHQMGLPWGGKWELALNSDEGRFGGSSTGPQAATKLKADARESDGFAHSLTFDVPPLGLTIWSSERPKVKKPRAKKTQGSTSKPK